MKYKDLSKLAKDELEKKIVEMKTELMKINAQVAIGTTPKSTKQIRELKKNIARYETLRMENFHKGMDELKGVSKVKKYRSH
ncbi:MAG: 50S ribosomal protein L29 [Candidatus Woesearchaeota archaeon]